MRVCGDGVVAARVYTVELTLADLKPYAVEELQIGIRA